MSRTKRATRIGLWLAAMAATTITSVVVLQSPSQAATLHCNRVGQSNDALAEIQRGIHDGEFVLLVDRVGASTARAAPTAR